MNIIRLLQFKGSISFYINRIRRTGTPIAALLLFLGLFSGMPLTAQNYNPAEVFNRLQRLKVLGSVMYFAAHPDDENTRLLAFLAKDRLYRTGYLSLTRGDGGQNLIGDEQGVDLGLIRTQELLAARRIDGAEQFFSRAFDFGFSKSTEEALGKWKEDQILADAVWIIRKFQPDIIITRFPEDQRAGHGQHSASAVIAHKAFFAAADSTRFPEQFKYGVRPWKVKRIFWNTYNFGNTNTTSNDQLKIEVGGYNAVLGSSYGELAARSRSQHKSQGFGVPSSRGSQLEYFVQWEGEKAATDPMENIDISWNRVPGGAKLGAMVDAIIKSYSIQEPFASVKPLVQLYKAVEALQPGYWKEQKLKEIRDLIIDCSGLWLEASASSEYAIQGDTLRLSVTATNRSAIPITIDRITIGAHDSVYHSVLTPNRNFQSAFSLALSDSTPISQPYWLEEKMDEAAYRISDQRLVGLPENKPAFTASFYLGVDGEPIRFDVPVRYKYTDPVKGEIFQPLVVVPGITLSTDPSVLVFKKAENKPKDFLVNLHANKVFNHYRATINARLGSQQLSQTDTSFIVTPGGEKDYTFSVTNKSLNGQEISQLQAYSELKNHTATQPAYLSLTSIRYDHIPAIHYFYQDAIKILNIDLKTVGKRIGYIEGAGDRVPVALQQMGYEVVILKEKDLTAANLAGFDAVITGVRAYNIHAYLTQRYDILMNYVRNGGNLIVQYNTNSQIGPIRAQMAPYPFNIGRGRVTDETARVSFTLPQHPVLNYPNKITDKDFENWIQERGIYFAEQADQAYQMPLQMNDPNEPAQNGSLLIASYGKGTFVYTGLVFFRELPAGVPGAYRLLANIIALNKKAPF